jgi:hypothetical protein
LTTIDHSAVEPTLFLPQAEQLSVNQTYALFAAVRIKLPRENLRRLSQALEVHYGFAEPKQGYPPGAISNPTRRAISINRPLS